MSDKKTPTAPVEQDILLEKTFVATGYILKNKDNFVKYGIGIAIVIALFIAYNLYQEENSKAANGMLGIALVDMKNTEMDKAESRLKLLTETYSGTDAANRAHFFLANINLSKGLVESAKNEFEAYSGSDNLFEAAVYAGLANCSEKISDFKNAANFYEKAANLEIRKELKNNYMFAAGVNFELASDNSSAKSIYEKLVEDKEYVKHALVEYKISSL